MPTSEKVIVELLAKVDGFDVKIRGSANAFDSAMNRLGKSSGKAEAKVSRDVRKIETELRSSSDAISRSIKGIAGAIAAGFSVRELANLADSFTRLQNNLRVAGLEGQALGKVQESLLSISRQYGVSIESLSGVFLKASLAQKELGASTEQIIQLNEIVAASLKITGTSAEQARGALLQLGQALGSDIVRGEEFNSLLENALPVVQAAARGIDRFEGSVTRLRKGVVDGNVTSREFFEGILKGGVKTLEDAEKATLTLAGGFTALTSALTVYFGEADKANGVSAALGEALGTLADNLDKIIPALTIVAVAIGGRLVAGALAGGTALRSFAAYASIATTSLAGTALAAQGVGAALLRAFGGPVGLAITAITTAVIFFGDEVETAAAKTERLNTAAQNAEAVAEKYENRLRQAGIAVDSLGDNADVAKGKVASLGSQMEIAAQQAFNLVKELERLGVTKITSRLGEIERERAAIQRANRGRGSIPGLDALGIVDFAETTLGLGKEDRASQLQALEQEQKGLTRQLKAIQTGLKNNVDVTEEAAGAVGAVSDSEQKKKAKAARAPREPQGVTAADIEDRFLSDLARLQAEELSARAQAARGAQERADLQFDLIDLEASERRRILDLEIADAKARVAESEKLTAKEKAEAVKFLDEQKKAQTEIINALYGVAVEIDEQGNIIATGPSGILNSEIRRELEERLVDQKRQMLDLEYGMIDSLIDIERNVGERNKLEQRALDIGQQIERSLLEQAIANGEIAEADKARALLAARQSAQQERLAVDQQSPFEDFRYDLETTSLNLNNALEDLGVETIKTFNAELRNAILNFESLGDVGRAALRTLTAGILDLAIQQLTLKLIGSTLGKAATASTAAEAGVVASAWAPAAALASLATLGSNAGPAAAAIAATTALTQALALTGGGRKDGGYIFGKGGPRDDKVLMAASPGEYVIRAAAAARLGPDRLNYLNATGEIPAFRDGGAITPLRPANGTISGRGSAVMMDPAFQRDLKAIVGDAIRAMPPINLYPTLEPGQVMEAGLASDRGRKAMFSFTTRNASRQQSNLQR